MKKYLIIAETEDTGYFVEYHDSLEKAKERAALYFELAFQPPIDLDLLYQEFSLISCYSIYEPHIYLANLIVGHSNGFFSTGVIEIDDSFSRRKYALLRGTAQSAFRGKELDRYFDWVDNLGVDLKFGFWVN